jgi:hypothetical protein
MRKMLYPALAGAVALGIFGLSALTNADAVPASDSTAARVAAGPLQCDFEGYEGILNYEEAAKDERTVYELGMGYANIGSRAVHEKLRADFAALTFVPDRAPIVSADLDSGRLHVFDCATDGCTAQEIAGTAPKACLDDLGASACFTFAVRVKGAYYCTLGPGLNE